jgi:hypothetical protein
MTLDGLTTDSTTVLAACACLSDRYLHLHLWNTGRMIVCGLHMVFFVRRSGQGHICLKEWVYAVVGLLWHRKHLPLLSSSSSSSSTIIISMDGKLQAGTIEHVAAGLDSNVARSHSVVDDSGQKQTLSEHVEDKSSDEPLNAIAMLNDPDFAAKGKALVRRLDMTFIPCLWILYFHNYLDRNNIARVLILPRSLCGDGY